MIWNGRLQNDVHFCSSLSMVMGLRSAIMIVVDVMKIVHDQRDVISVR